MIGQRNITIAQTYDHVERRKIRDGLLLDLPHYASDRDYANHLYDTYIKVHSENTAQCRDTGKTIKLAPLGAEFLRKFLAYDEKRFKSVRISSWQFLDVIQQIQQRQSNVPLSQFVLREFGFAHVDHAVDPQRPILGSGRYLLVPNESLASHSRPFLLSIENNGRYLLTGRAWIALNQEIEETDIREFLDFGSPGPTRFIEWDCAGYEFNQLAGVRSDGLERPPYVGLIFKHPVSLKPGGFVMRIKQGQSGSEHAVEMCSPITEALFSLEKLSAQAHD